LSGLMAALGAQGIGWVLATYVFEFHIDFNPWLVPAGIVAGVVCSGVGGWMPDRDPDNAWSSAISYTQNEPRSAHCAPPR